MDESFRNVLAVVGAGVLGCLACADPVTVTMTSSRDNTLIETADGSLSNGAGDSFYAGRIGPMAGGTLRRGVIYFNVADVVPASSEVTEVTLELYMQGFMSSNETVFLKRLLADWGEGTSLSSGGAGDASTQIDATWLHRFWPDVFWSAPGGDFTDTVSASAVVGSVGWYSWSGTAQLVADVQDWINDPASNFGWLVQGNEEDLQSVKRFSSRESHPNFRPILSVTYTTPSTCVPADLDCSGSVGVPDLLILLANWGTCADPDDCPADLDGNGSVGVADLLILLANWG